MNFYSNEIMFHQTGTKNANKETLNYIVETK